MNSILVYVKVTILLVFLPSYSDPRCTELLILSSKTQLLRYTLIMILFLEEDGHLKKTKSS